MNPTNKRELEKKLWSAADSLRGNISSEQYMHIVIGILFLKFISDAYDLKWAEIQKEYPDLSEQIKDDRDFFGEVFIVPPEAKWDYLCQFASTKTIGEKIDNAFGKLEETNDSLKGLFDKSYNNVEIDQNKLGQVVTEFSNLQLDSHAEDLFGRVYEYFLGEFFKKQGQKGGEFYTPKSITKIMVDFVNPEEGLLYDPACGTGGLFIQSKQHLAEQNKNYNKLIIYGQEYQNKTWKLARINLLINGFDIQNIHLGNYSADTFTDDQHEKMHDFDYILANPPFNQKKWGLEKLENDVRWKWGTPPKNNANYAWLSHILYKLNDHGRAAVVLAEGSLSGLRKEEVIFRKNILNDNLLDCIISLPDKLFYTTQISASIWILNKNKSNQNVLMINAHNFEGKMLSKKLRELKDEEIQQLVQVYDQHSQNQEVNELGFAKTVNLQEIRENDYALSPGRYVGYVEEEIDVEKAKEEIITLSKELDNLFDEFTSLMPEVKNSIKKALAFEHEREDGKE